MDLKTHNEVSKTATESESAVEAKLSDILKENGWDFEITPCCGNRVCIALNGADAGCEKLCCNSDIIVQTSTKDVCRIRPCDIIYVAIENRKSAVYVDGKRIETTYPLDFWKKSLNPKIFAQPHSSFLVNLCCVDEVTKDYVKLKHKNNEYSVYTSSRKLKGFKKAFLEYKK